MRCARCALITKSNLDSLSSDQQIKLSLLLSYIKSTGIHWFLFSLLFFTVMEACTVGTGIWLAYWSSAKHTTRAQRDFYLTVYGGIGAGQALFSLLYSLMLLLGAIRASRTLHRKLIVNILRLPMTFFDVTPLGRIMNRISKDIYGIDVTIPNSLRSFFAMFFDVLGMLVAVSYATPIFLAVLPPLGALYFYIQVGLVSVCVTNLTPLILGDKWSKVSAAEFISGLFAWRWGTPGR